MITELLAPAAVPAGHRLYAIGDVHGCADRLATMHRMVRQDLAERPTVQATLVHLGDMIDRGPDSAGVLAAVLEPWAETPAPRVVNLLGNHEAMLLDALEGGDPRARDLWMDNGGAETLRSWGISHRAPPRAWRDSIPPRQLGLLRALTLMHRAGGYVLVHAGVRPGVALEAQTRHDLLWIREPFLRWDATLPKVVVHGHTPAAAPVLRANRIGIDTGAVLGGPLTCAVLERRTVAFMQC